MINIDISTLFFLIVIANMFTIFFFSIYIRLYHVKVQKLNFYVVARILQSITWLAYALNIGQLNNVIMAATMIPLAIGIALEAYCLITANQQFVKRKLRFLLFIALIFSIFYIFIARIPSFRILVASLFLCFLYGYIWVDLSLRKPRTKLQQITGWLGFMLSFLFVFRELNMIFNQIEIDIYSQHYFNILIGIGIFITTSAWPLIFLLLQKEEAESVILSNEKLIMEKNEKLKLANASKDKLFSIISHDLINPFNSILGFMELVIMNVKKQNYKNVERYSEMVYRSAEESHNLLTNLLHWSSMHTGKLKLEPSTFDLEELVDHCINLLQTNLKEKGINFEKDIMPGLKLIADRIMIEATIRNLMSNAIKFTPTGGTISLNATQSDVETSIEISDNGMGISPENLKTLFQKEDRLSTEGTKHEKGTGLGLLLCKEFVQMHKGQITVESEINKGSVFRVTLPLIIH